VRYQTFTQAADEAAGVFPIAGRDYLEKIVQIPFELPPLDAHAIQCFLHSRLPAVPALSEEEAEHVAALMTAGLLRNPRKVKRTFNTFRVHLTLDRAHGRTTSAGLIAKLVVIQSSFADLYERITLAPTALRDIERIVRGTPGTSAIDQALREVVAASDPRLKEMLYMQPFFEECSEDELRELVYRSRMTRDSGGEP
jgi:plasmid stabilization system protein ParE